MRVTTQTNRIPKGERGWLVITQYISSELRKAEDKWLKLSWEILKLNLRFLGMTAEVALWITAYLLNVVAESIAEFFRSIFLKPRSDSARRS